MELIDTICHIDAPEFASDSGQVLTAARQRHVQGFIVAGITSAGWPAIEATLAQGDDIYPAYGIHPQFIADSVSQELERLERWLADHPAVAIGETGLDYYDKPVDTSSQCQLFEGQLSLARKLDLPVILHVRKAHDEVLKYLRQSDVKGGTAHAFNGSLQQAKHYIDLGFKLGFGGMVTFERSRKIRELAASLPLDALVLESDAPDMTVASHHGERNSPAYLPEVAQALAEVRGVPLEEIAAATTANARAVFDFSRLTRRS